MKPQNRKLLDEDGPRTITSPSLPRDILLPPLLPATNTSTARKSLNPTSGFDSSMALTVLVLFSALFFMGFFSVYIRRFAEEDANEISRRRRQQRRTSSSSSTPSGASPHGLDPSTVRSLPLFAYDGNAKEPGDCVVCLSEFEEKESVKLIPYCGHVFHPQCMDMWFLSHASCPLCRSTQLFPLPSVKKDARLNVFEQRFDQGVRDSPERSTVGCGDTSIERQIEILSGMRRTSSCSSLGERVSLQRSSSF